MQDIRVALQEKGWPQKVIEHVLNTFRSGAKPLLQLKNVSKHFGKEVVLNCVTLDIYAGEIFAVIGVSGCGKTTLLNTLVGFVEPDEGGVTLNIDAEPTYEVEKFIPNPNAIKSLFGFSTQSPSFYENLTVEENLEYFASLYGLKGEEIQKNKNSLLKLLGLEGSKDKFGSDLSRGMQKRLDIGCALIHNPKILILDEPTADLDPFLRGEMWALVQEINKTGTTIVLTSHFLSELESFCDRLAVLYNHAIVAIGTPLELKKYYTNNYEIHFQIVSHQYEPLLAKLKQQKELGITKMHIERHKAVLYTLYPQQTLQALIMLINKSKQQLLDIDVNRPSIQEIFETMLKR